MLAKGIGAGVEQSGAKELRSAAHRRAARSARTRRTAEEYLLWRRRAVERHDIAPHRTRRSRRGSASRTEIASISGGSPTALLPNTTARLGGALEKADAEVIGHFRPGRQLVGRRTGRRRDDPDRPRAAPRASAIPRPE